jgi:signal transduction histidine kinase
MSRPWQIWLIFAACLIVAVTAVGWLSVKALQTEQARAEARHAAAVEENARLALWRMDSFMTPILAEENVRPWFMYGANSRQKSNQVGETVLATAPTSQSPPFVKLHFQFALGSPLTSFEISQNELLGTPELATTKGTEGLVAALADLQSLLNFSALNAALPKLVKSTELAEPVSSPGSGSSPHLENQFAQSASDNLGQQVNTDLAPNAAVPNAQSQRNQNEYQARSKSVAQNNLSAQNLGMSGGSINSIASPSTPPATVPTAAVATSMMKPLWNSGNLLLVRRAIIGGQEYGQGCVLDWPVIKQALLKEITDLLPAADLLSVADLADDSESHRLASLPVILIPGAVAEFLPPGLSPIEQSLLLAWGALALAALAAFVLLRGVVVLSERRAAFVSAVTHELRTPLTTFRMYAEMLSEGMISDKAQQRHYLETLRIEADRLTHLVANVLAYARLERGQPASRMESLTVEKLLAVVTQRLADRAMQAQFQLRIEPFGPVLGCVVRTDPTAVEQILFNLVDNACKYAASTANHTLHLSVVHQGVKVNIRLLDHGPGISAAEQRRLFQPFRKSAKQAAHSAPGVGLGLALSRRLARDMNCELRHEATTDGACFVLILPMAE